MIGAIVLRRERGKNPGALCIPFLGAQALIAAMVAESITFRSILVEHIWSSVLALSVGDIRYPARRLPAHRLVDQSNWD